MEEMIFPSIHKTFPTKKKQQKSISLLQNDFPVGSITNKILQRKKK